MPVVKPASPTVLNVPFCNLKFVNVDDGSEVHFKMGMRTRFGKAFQAYSQNRKGNWTFFSPNYDVIASHQTPETLRLNNDDVIEVVHNPWST